MFVRKVLAVSLFPLLFALSPCVCPAQTGQAVIELTSAEKQWIAEHPEVAYGADPSWPPYSQVSQSGRLEGIDPEILALISKRTGLRFVYYRTHSWPETVAALNSGTIAFCTGISRTDERAGSLLFTREYMSYPIGIISRDDSQFLTTVSALDKKKIAIPSEYVLHPWLSQTLPGATIISLPTAAEAHKYVAAGKADVTVENLLVSAYLTGNLGLTNLKVSGVLDKTFALRYGVKPAEKPLASILDKAVESLTRREIDAIAQNWIRYDFTPVPMLHRLRPWIYSIFALAAVALLTSSLWIHRLRREVARRKKTVAALKAAHESLHDAHEERTCLMQITAHDLRNPLTALLSSVSLLEKQPGPSPATSKWMEILKESAGRIEHLLRVLLDFETIQSGRYPLNIGTVPVRAVVDKVIRRSVAIATRKEIRFEILDECPDASVMADAHAFEEILENILSNALKFTRHSTRVLVRTSCAEHAIRVSVTDQGPGLSKRDMRHVFERFARLSATPTGGEQSIGLGLWIAHRLADLQNGRLWCESVDGEGATFHVDLPTVTAASNAASNAPQSGTPKPFEAGPSQSMPHPAR